MTPVRVLVRADGYAPREGGHELVADTGLVTSCSYSRSSAKNVAQGARHLGDVSQVRPKNFGANSKMPSAPTMGQFKSILLVWAAEQRTHQLRQQRGDLGDRRE